ncbi:MAG: terminase B [Clostridiales bacterium]|nr:terminase B [Clostridiales bacterium]
MLSSKAVQYYAGHPVEFVQDVIKVNPDPMQADILRSVATNQMTSVRSGHGVGKSAVEAWAVIWFMCTHPFPKIPCTAPTQHQLFDILWAEISKWKRNNKALDTELIWTKEKLYMRGHSEEWFAVARTASTPDALQGFHAEHMLYIIDEASGVDDKIFEPVLGALSTPGARLLMCGNPTQLSGFFYESHHKNRENYSTMHIDGRKSTRVSEEFVQMIVGMYGEDSDVFRVRVAGDFPLAEDDICIPLPLIEKSIQTEFFPRSHPDIIHIGCDVARFGTDKTVIGYRTDEKIQFFKKRVGQDTMKTADDIVLLGSMLVMQYGLKKGKDFPIPVKIDDSGVGGGATDRLRQLKKNNPERFWWMEIYPVNFGKRIKHKFYDDSTTYMMYTLKHLLQPYDDSGKPKDVEVILPDDDALVAQLSGRKYGMTENGKLRVESKKVMKARGVQSPDEADCVLLICLPVKRPKKREETKTA